MSTILKTLKKLEDEKSVLDQSLDLKGLVLKGEDEFSGNPVGESPKKVWAFAVWVLLGVGLGASLVFYTLSPSKVPVENTKPPANMKLEKEPLQQNSRVAKKSHTGIPLANIPETGGLAAEEESFWDKEEIDIEFADESPAAQPLEAAAPVPAQIETEQVVVTREIQEIDAIIKSATQLALKDESTPNSVATNTSELLPGLSVKGVIFFNDNDPANYIFVSTPTEKNKKLKAGDVIMNATLESIEPNWVVFTLDGDPVEFEIGDRL